MNHHYSDIRDRIAEEPTWWDEDAVPRYCKFAPSEVSNIYAEEVVLLLIACQSCGHEFPVALSRASHGGLSAIVRGIKTPTLTELVRSGSIWYGDPPNIYCCPAGPTMTSDTIKVLEFWRRQTIGGWIRDEELEDRDMVDVPGEGE